MVSQQSKAIRGSRLEEMQKQYWKMNWKLENIGIKRNSKKTEVIVLVSNITKQYSSSLFNDLKEAFKEKKWDLGFIDVRRYKMKK